LIDVASSACSFHSPENAHVVDERCVGKWNSVATFSPAPRRSPLGQAYCSDVGLGLVSSNGVRFATDVGGGSFSPGCAATRSLRIDSRSMHSYLRRNRRVARHLGVDEYSAGQYSLS